MAGSFDGNDEQRLCLSAEKRTFVSPPNARPWLVRVPLSEYRTQELSAVLRLWQLDIWASASVSGAGELFEFDVDFIQDTHPMARPRLANNLDRIVPATVLTLRGPRPITWNRNHGKSLDPEAASEMQQRVVDRYHSVHLLQLPRKGQHVAVRSQRVDMNRGIRRSSLHAVNVS